MNRRVCSVLVVSVWTAAGGIFSDLQGAQITLPLQTRDEQNRPQVSAVQVEGAQLGVVVMDT